jgi:hypothetical protein
LCDTLQHLIADGMAVLVVDRLEVVHVHHNDGQGVFIALGVGPEDAQVIEEGTPIETAGERVFRCHKRKSSVLLAHSLVRLFQLLDHRNQFAVAIVNRSRKVSMLEHPAQHKHGGQQAHKRDKDHQPGPWG